MKRLMLFLGFLFCGVGVTLLLASCMGYLPPTINIRADGVVEHRDTQDMPCKNAQGCYQQQADGSRHIWSSTLAPWYVSRHENAHAKKMEHTDFEPWWNMGWTCATVTLGDTENVYRIGDTICVTQTTELILHHGA